MTSGGGDEWTRAGLEQVRTRGVVSVVAIDIGAERAGIDDQSDGCTSLARISSMRSEMSSRPLAPAPAARRRPLPGRAPRKVSIAFGPAGRWALGARRDSGTAGLSVPLSVRRSAGVACLFIASSTALNDVDGETSPRRRTSSARLGSSLMNAGATPSSRSATLFDSLMQWRTGAQLEQTAATVGIRQRDLDRLIDPARTYCQG